MMSCQVSMLLDPGLTQQKGDVENPTRGLAAINW